MIDLSIPNNINPDTSTLANVMLANVDDLSKINDDTLLKDKMKYLKLYQ